jgi:prephenate dehydratase
VQSHPVALAQCKRFFAEHPRLKPINADDTAGSVAEIMRRGDPTRAAIAGRRAAEIYGASIIRESIQDQPENFTRFVLLSVKGNES